MGQITKPLEWHKAKIWRAHTPIGDYTISTPLNFDPCALSFRGEGSDIARGGLQGCKDAAQAHYEALVLDILDNTTVVADLLERAADAQDASRLALDRLQASLHTMTLLAQTRLENIIALEGRLRHERNATIDACIDVVGRFSWIGGKEGDELCDRLVALKAPA